MHAFNQDMLNKIRMKCLNYPLNHPIACSSRVAFRDIFDPYCAEYKGINDDMRIAILCGNDARRYYYKYPGIL